jgi:hypothetical protein
VKTKKKILKFLISAALLGALNGCGHIPGKLELRAPSVLPNTTRQMKTAGFWIAKIADPDKIVLTLQEIDTVNVHTQNQEKLIEDITLPQTSFEGKEVVAGLMKSLNFIREQSLFLESGNKAGEEFFAPIIRQMDLAAMPDKITVRYGLAVHYTDQRILPTTNALYGEKGDVDFDELQNSSLDVGVPIVVLYQTRDGRWIYGKTQHSAGWVQARDVAMAHLDDIKRYAARDHVVVVTVPKADIFLNRELTQYYDYVRMGTVLPLLKEDGNIVEVKIPTRNPEGTSSEVPGYLKKDEISVGFLPYTPRNMVDQAFKMLNSPYGWGGMYGEQDCSSLIQEVFSTVGLVMPRNANQQAQVGILAASFSGQENPDVKLAALQHQAVPGITTLYMQGHIMLYLGSVEGRPYVIHASWGYREKCLGAKSGQECRQEAVCVMNRVVVSDLSLGEGSRKKSLLQRLLTVRRVDGSKGVLHQTGSNLP